MGATLARPGAGRLLLFGLLLVAALLLALSVIFASNAKDDRPKSALTLMTTLPLQWSEGGVEADLAQDAEPHPALERLRRHYEVLPIDDLNAWKPKPGEMLFLAQPRAFRPSELVTLDAWVRDGGRVLIMADPALQWGSLYPLGDKRRPLFTSLLSPLFTHWGIELVLPLADDPPAALRKVGSFQIRTVTPGEWLPKPQKTTGECAIMAQALLADCRIGKGRAVLVADADLLDTVFWEGQGMRVITGDDEFANMALVDAVLSALRDNQDLRGDFMGK